MAEMQLPNNKIESTKPQREEASKLASKRNVWVPIVGGTMVATGIGMYVADTPIGRTVIEQVTTGFGNSANQVDMNQIAASTAEYAGNALRPVEGGLPEPEVSNYDEFGNLLPENQDDLPPPVMITVDERGEAFQYELSTSVEQSEESNRPSTRFAAGKIDLRQPFTITFPENVTELGGGTISRSFDIGRNYVHTASDRGLDQDLIDGFEDNQEDSVLVQATNKDRSNIVNFHSDVDNWRLDRDDQAHYAGEVFDAIRREGNLGELVGQEITITQDIDGELVEQVLVVEATNIIPFEDLANMSVFGVDDPDLSAHLTIGSEPGQLNLPGEADMMHMVSCTGGYNPLNGQSSERVVVSLRPVESVREEFLMKRAEVGTPAHVAEQYIYNPYKKEEDNLGSAFGTADSMVAIGSKPEIYNKLTAEGSIYDSIKTFMSEVRPERFQQYLETNNIEENDDEAFDVALKSYIASFGLLSGEQTDFYMNILRGGSRGTTIPSVKADGEIEYASISIHTDVLEEGVNPLLLAEEFIQAHQYNDVIAENLDYFMTRGYNNIAEIHNDATRGNLRSGMELIAQQYSDERGIGINFYHFMVGPNSFEPSELGAAFSTFQTMVNNSVGEEMTAADLMNGDNFIAANEAVINSSAYGADAYDYTGMKRFENGAPILDINPDYQ